MSTFSALYKKSFRQLLIPYGYGLYNSLFYKEVNKELCFFITVKKKTHYPWYSVYFGLLPYCYDITSDLEEISDIPDMLQFELTSFMQKLSPEFFNRETASVYCESRFHVDLNNDDKTLNSLRNVGNDMINFVLPYLHKFTDLEYYYKELLKENTYNCADLEFYGLSLKFHRYDNALIYVNHKISHINKVLDENIESQNRLKCNKLNNVDKQILKNDPNYINFIEERIAELKDEIIFMEKIKSSLIDTNTVYLDKMVTEVEERSCKYLRSLLKIN